MNPVIKVVPVVRPVAAVVRPVTVVKPIATQMEIAKPTVEHIAKPNVKHITKPIAKSTMKEEKTENTSTIKQNSITKTENDWCNHIFNIYQKDANLLNEGYSYMNTPNTFKAGLYPHQMVALKALSDLEDKRYLKVTDNKSENPFIIETDATILSEKLGSGKTIIILALICEKQRPNLIIPEYIKLPTFKIENNYRKTSGQLINDNADRKICNEIKMKFSSMLNPNAIVIGKAVIQQWEKAITTFTNKTFYTICDQRTLTEFYKLYKHNVLNHYDIILIKNSMVSNFYLANEDKSTCLKLRSIPDIVALMTYSTPFSRVIYDDFDTIDISKEAIKINALYTIFVSTTMNNSSDSMYIQTLPITTKYNSPIELIVETYGKRRLLDVFQDAKLFKMFNIKNNNEFIKKSTNVPIFNTYKCVYTNTANNFIEMMGNLGANELAEMMNGDAVRTAAEKIGITARSPFEIFKKLLKNKYDNYMNLKILVDTFTNFLNHIKRLIDMKDLPPTITADGKEKRHPSNHTDTQIREIINSITKDVISICKGTTLITKYTKNNSNSLSIAINDIIHQYKREYDISGIEINRMKDNLREQMCVVCKMDTDGEVDIMIPRCCSNIIGTDCFKITGTISKCPGCGIMCNIATDVVYIRNDFDMNSLLNAKGDEIAIIEEKVKSDDDITIDNPKLQALYNIITGKTPDNMREIKMTLNSVIEGTTTIDTPKTQKQKILLFANYNETLELVEEFLEKQNIKYMQLTGDFRKLDDIITTFRTSDDINVLLINSQQICAGLNLQFATSIVFFHKLTNIHVEAQVIGRAQRIGRTSNLKVYFLLYTNEAQSL